MVLSKEKWGHLLHTATRLALGGSLPRKRPASPIRGRVVPLLNTVTMTKSSRWSTDRGYQGARAVGAGAAGTGVKGLQEGDLCSDGTVLYLSRAAGDIMERCDQMTQS